MSIRYSLNISENGPSFGSKFTVDLTLDEVVRAETLDPETRGSLEALMFSGNLRVNDDEDRITLIYAPKNPIISSLVFAHTKAVAGCVATKVGARMTSIVAKRWRRTKVSKDSDSLEDRFNEWAFFVLHDFESGQMHEEFRKGFVRSLWPCAFGVFEPYLSPFFYD